MLEKDVEKVKAKNLERSVRRALFIGGVLFAAITVFVAVKEMTFTGNAVKYKATVSRIDVENSDNIEDADRVRVYVKYTVDGIEYERNLGYRDGRMYVGRVVKIYYNPNDPGNIYPADSEVMYYCMLGTFLFIAVTLSVAMNISVRKRRLMKQELLRSGNKVIAEFVSVDINKRLKDDDRYLYIIRCKWTDRYGVSHTLKSENLWFDPAPIIEKKHIKTFPVYMDLRNSKRYYVSLEELEDGPGEG